MNKEQIKALQEALEKAVIKELKIAIDDNVKSQVEELVKTAVEDNKTTLEDIKEEVKGLKEKLEEKEAQNLNKNKVEKTIASIFKGFSKEAKIGDEKANDIIENSIKDVLGTGANATNTSLSNAIFNQFHKDIITYIETDKFIKEISFTTITKGDSYTFVNAENGITTEYVEQASKGSASSPNLSRMTINVHKIYSQVNITEEQYDQMTSTDIYNLIVKFIAESQTKFIRKEILSGNTKMTGVLNLVGANIVEIGANLATFTDDNLIDIQGSLPEEVLNTGKPVHIMSRYVLTQLRKLKLTTGARMYPELRGENPTLDGDKVIIAKEGSEIVSKADDIAGKKAWVYGIFKNAKAVRRQGLKYQKGYVNDGMLTGIETTVAKQRLGMKVINEKAFTIIETK